MTVYILREVLFYKKISPCCATGTCNHVLDKTIQNIQVVKMYVSNFLMMPCNVEVC